MKTEAAKALAMELAQEVLDAGEISADMLRDLEDHLYRQAIDQAQEMGAPQVG